MNTSPTTYYARRRHFSSKIDGRLMVEFHLYTDPDGKHDAIDAWIEDEQRRSEPLNGSRYDENSDVYWDSLVPQAMAWTAQLMRVALGVAPEDADIEGLNGGFIVDADKVPMGLRSDGVTAFTMTVLS